MATKFCVKLTSHSLSVPASFPFLHSQISQHCLYSPYFCHPSAHYEISCVNYTNETALVRSAVTAFSRSQGSVVTYSSSYLIFLVPSDPMVYTLIQTFS